MSNDTENHGKKVVAGKLLSKFIRDIASEEYDDPIIKAKGEEAVMVTKAEAIARHIWNVALGYVEEVDIYKDGVKTGVKLETHRPDKWAISIIWDRMEGRVGQADVKAGSDKASLADRVSALGKKHMNQIAKGV
ncbi:hypothetical protein LCGC14_0864930 [marine sediment metagenome]|uniref:Uncharacterized protein n=1 Tax=marine sediment metagenome TaxID=412755 RepID=A0A0F9RR01_9ZZZZ